MENKRCTFSGKDWSNVAPNANLQDEFKRSDYFLHEAVTPWNLGVVCPASFFESTTLTATRFVGVSPVLKKPEKESRAITNTHFLIQIDPRANIDPIYMLKKVMTGDDYFTSPDLFTIKNFTPAQLIAIEEESHRKNSEKGKWDRILFGRITGIGNVQIDQPGDNKELQFGPPAETQDNNAPSAQSAPTTNETKASLSPFMTNLVGVLEIMDFLQKTRKLLQKNVLHTMERVEENLTGKVRGKILIGKQIRVNEMRGQMQKVYCSFTRLSENNRENRILRWTLHLCEIFDGGKLADSLMDDISYCRNALAEVPLVRCGLQDFVGLKTNSAYRDYQEVLEAAKQIIANTHLSYTTTDVPMTEGGSAQKSGLQVVYQPQTVIPFFLDIDYLFELYCRAVLCEAIKNNQNWKLAPKVRQKLFIDGEDVRKDIFMQEYETDMTVIDSDNTPIAVLDAKNSTEDNAYRKRRKRTHQLLFYMQALGCNCGGLVLRGSNTTSDKKPVPDKETVPGEKNAFHTFEILKNGKSSADKLGWLTLSGDTSQAKPTDSADTSSADSGKVPNTASNTNRDEPFDAHVKQMTEFLNKLLNQQEG